MRAQIESELISRVKVLRTGANPNSMTKRRMLLFKTSFTVEQLELRKASYPGLCGEKGFVFLKNSRRRDQKKRKRICLFNLTITKK